MADRYAHLKVERTCHACGIKIRGPGFFSHVKKHKDSEGRAIPVKARPSVVKAPEPKEDGVLKRLGEHDALIKALGKAIPVSPNGVMLTSIHSRSYLTQFIMNLEGTLRWARKVLDLVDEHEKGLVEAEVYRKVRES